MIPKWLLIGISATAVLISIWIVAQRRGKSYHRARIATSINEYSVVTYNIQRLPWNKKQLDPLVHILSDHSIIFLQEYFYRWTKLGIEDYFPEHYICKGTLKGLRMINSGLVILSKFPILHSEFIAFDAYNPLSFDRFSEKGFLSALVEIDNQNIRLITTHLQSSTHEEYDLYGLSQLEQLFNYLDHLPVPYLIGGDFNIDIEEIRKRYPERTFYCPTDPSIYINFHSGDTQSTPRKGYQGRTLDYFISPTISCTSPRVITSQFSDHNPVQTMISLSAKE